MVFFGLGDWYYRKCVLYTYGGGCSMFVCVVVVYSTSGILFVCWALGINTVGHGIGDI